jgi:hypothetical protein
VAWLVWGRGEGGGTSIGFNAAEEMQNKLTFLSSLESHRLSCNKIIPIHTNLQIRWQLFYSFAFKKMINMFADFFFRHHLYHCSLFALLQWRLVHAFYSFFFLILYVTLLGYQSFSSNASRAKVKCRHLLVSDSRCFCFTKSPQP